MLATAVIWILIRTSKVAQATAQERCESRDRQAKWHICPLLKVHPKRRRVVAGRREGRQGRGEWGGRAEAGRDRLHAISVLNWGKNKHRIQIHTKYHSHWNVFIDSLNCVTVILKAHLKSHHILSIQTKACSVLQFIPLLRFQFSFHLHWAFPRPGMGAEITRQGCIARRTQKRSLSKVTSSPFNYTLLSLKDVLKLNNVICLKCTKNKRVKQMIRNSPKHQWFRCAFGSEYREKHIQVFV